ncbi:hypothetical protein [Paraburkholderia sp. BCC1885]|uniref:hypothetical protein n=1 Tax=Paraburkholderia sp. BCC1885 TaxID=2562669 RepID=UPI001181D5CC|nr:hypothetical protein [Paraburkholderia sp. BCC1885]
MLRFLSVGALLLAVTSTAAAGEHYVEVWNPPEARIGHPARPCKPKMRKTALPAHGMSKVGTRRVADLPAGSLANALTKTSAAKHGAGDAAKKVTSPRFIDIPRILTPEGNVLQVSTGGRASVHVVR